MHQSRLKRNLAKKRVAVLAAAIVKNVKNRTHCLQHQNLAAAPLTLAPLTSTEELWCVAIVAVDRALSIGQHR